MTSNNSFKSIFIAFIFFTTFIIFGLYKPLILLDDTQISYVFSTIAQILGAIFALTIPSYIFFSDKLDKRQNKEEILEEAIRKIKDLSYKSMKTISILTLLTEVLCLLTISGESLKTYLLKNFFINSTISLFLIDFFLILLFIKNMIEPQIVEKTLSQLSKTSPYKAPNHMQGAQTAVFYSSNLSRFLNYFCKIEKLLRSFENDYFFSKQIKKFSSRKKNSLTFIVRMLFQNQIIQPDLNDKLILLIYFRNRVVHGDDTFVPKDAAIDAENLYHALQENLRQRDSRTKSNN